MRKHALPGSRGLIFSCLTLFLAILTSAQSIASSAVRVWQDTMEIPTYEEGLPDENPPFDQFVTNGRYNYPYTIRENLTNRVAPRRWRTLNLENDYLKCVILPDLGRPSLPMHR